MNELRIGVISDNMTMLLDITRTKKHPDLHYIKLFAKNIDKNQANETELAKLKSPIVTFKAKDTGDIK